MLSFCFQVFRTVAAGAIYLTAFATLAALGVVCLSHQTGPMIFHAVYRPYDWNVSELPFIAAAVIFAVLAVGVLRLTSDLLFGSPTRT